MFTSPLSVLILFATSALCQNLVLTNDDGWATAQIRAQYSSLEGVGYNVILSAPAENESGTGSSSATPKALSSACEYNTCPAGSPPEGSNSTNPMINYVNSYPVNAAQYGIQTLAPKFFGGPPEFVVSGPNIGTNLGTVVNVSGTVGAACEAAILGVPSTAFSGTSTSQVSYTTLSSSPTSTDTIASLIYANLTTAFTQALLASSARPILPPNVTINVNYPSISNCPSPSSFQFVLTRLVSSPGSVDVETCGTNHLPVETTAIQQGCTATVSVMSALTKSDVNAATQQAVLNRISGFLSCLS